MDLGLLHFFKFINCKEFQHTQKGRNYQSNTNNTATFSQPNTVSKVHYLSYQALKKQKRNNLENQSIPKRNKSNEICKDYRLNHHIINIKKEPHD